MKRSDMLHKLRELLISNVVNYDGRDLITTTYDAKMILDFIEENGMIPLGEYHSSGCLHSMREMCNCQSYYENKWEDE